MPKGGKRLQGPSKRAGEQPYHKDKSKSSRSSDAAEDEQGWAVRDTAQDVIDLTSSVAAPVQVRMAGESSRGNGGTASPRELTDQSMNAETKDVEMASPEQNSIGGGEPSPTSSTVLVTAAPTPSMVLAPTASMSSAVLVPSIGMSSCADSFAMVSSACGNGGTASPRVLEETAVSEKADGTNVETGIARNSISDAMNVDAESLAGVSSARGNGGTASPRVLEETSANEEAKGVDVRANVDTSAILTSVSATMATRLGTEFDPGVLQVASQDNVTKMLNVWINQFTNVLCGDPVEGEGSGRASKVEALLGDPSVAANILHSVSASFNGYPNGDVSGDEIARVVNMKQSFVPQADDGSAWATGVPQLEPKLSTVVLNYGNSNFWHHYEGWVYTKVRSVLLMKTIGDQLQLTVGLTTGAILNLNFAFVASVLVSANHTEFDNLCSTVMASLAEATTKDWVDRHQTRYNTLELPQVEEVGVGRSPPELCKTIVKPVVLAGTQPRTAVQGPASPAASCRSFSLESAKESDLGTLSAASAPAATTDETIVLSSADEVVPPVASTASATSSASVNTIPLSAKAVAALPSNVKLGASADTKSRRSQKSYMSGSSQGSVLSLLSHNQEALKCIFTLTQGATESEEYKRAAKELKNLLPPEQILGLLQGDGARSHRSARSATSKGSRPRGELIGAPIAPKSEEASPETLNPDSGQVISVGGESDLEENAEAAAKTIDCDDEFRRQHNAKVKCSLGLNVREKLLPSLDDHEARLALCGGQEFVEELERDYTNGILTAAQVHNQLHTVTSKVFRDQTGLYDCAAAVLADYLYGKPCDASRDDFTMNIQTVLSLLMEVSDELFLAHATEMLATDASFASACDQAQLLASESDMVVDDGVGEGRNGGAASPGLRQPDRLTAEEGYDLIRPFYVSQKGTTCVTSHIDIDFLRTSDGNVVPGSKSCVVSPDGSKRMFTLRHKLVGMESVSADIFDAHFLYGKAVDEFLRCQTDVQYTWWSPAMGNNQKARADPSHSFKPNCGGHPHLWHDSELTFTATVGMSQKFSVFNRQLVSYTEEQMWMPFYRMCSYRTVTSLHTLLDLLVDPEPSVHKKRFMFANNAMMDVSDMEWWEHYSSLYSMWSVLCNGGCSAVRDTPGATVNDPETKRVKSGGSCYLSKRNTGDFYSLAVPIRPDGLYYSVKYEFVAKSGAVKMCKSNKNQFMADSPNDLVLIAMVVEVGSFQYWLDKRNACTMARGFPLELECAPTWNGEVPKQHPDSKLSDEEASNRREWIREGKAIRDYRTAKPDLFPSPGPKWSRDVSGPFRSSTGALFVQLVQGNVKFDETVEPPAAPSGPARSSTGPPPPPPRSEKPAQGVGALGRNGGTASTGSSTGNKGVWEGGSEANAKLQEELLSSRYSVANKRNAERAMSLSRNLDNVLSACEFHRDPTEDTTSFWIDWLHLGVIFLRARADRNSVAAITDEMWEDGTHSGSLQPSELELKTLIAQYTLLSSTSELTRATEVLSAEVLTLLCNKKHPLHHMVAGVYPPNYEKCSVAVDGQGRPMVMCKKTPYRERLVFIGDQFANMKKDSKTAKMPYHSMTNVLARIFNVQFHKTSHGDDKKSMLCTQQMIESAASAVTFVCDEYYKDHEKYVTKDVSVNYRQRPEGVVAVSPEKTLPATYHAVCIWGGDDLLKECKNEYVDIPEVEVNKVMHHLKTLAVWMLYWPKGVIFMPLSHEWTNGSKSELWARRMRRAAEVVIAEGCPVMDMSKYLTDYLGIHSLGMHVKYEDQSKSTLVGNSNHDVLAQMFAVAVGSAYYGSCPYSWTRRLTNMLLTDEMVHIVPVNLYAKIANQEEQFAHEETDQPAIPEEELLRYRKYAFTMLVHCAIPAASDLGIEVVVNMKSLSAVFNRFFKQHHRFVELAGCWTVEALLIFLKKQTRVRNEGRRCHGRIVGFR